MMIHPVDLFLLLTIFCAVPVAPKNDSDLEAFFALDISSDFEKGIPSNNGNNTSKRNSDSSFSRTEEWEDDRVDEEEPSSSRERDFRRTKSWTKNFSVVAFDDDVVPNTQSEDLFKISRDFMQGNPEPIKSKISPSVKRQNSVPQMKTPVIKAKQGAIKSKGKAMEVDSKKWKPKIASPPKVRSRLNASTSVDRRIDANIGSKMLKMKKNIIKKAVGKRRMFGNQLFPQASYISPATAVVPTTIDTSGQVLLASPQVAQSVPFLASPQVAQSVPFLAAPQQQQIAFSTGLLQSSPVQIGVNQAAPLQAVPVQASSPVVASPQIRLMAPFSVQPLASPQMAQQFSPVTIAQAPANVFASPTFQTVPVSTVQLQAVQVQATSPGQFQTTNPIQLQTIQRSPQIDATGNLRAALLSPPTISSVSYAPLSLNRSPIAVRSPVGYTSKAVRTTSYYNPPVPQRSRTVFTQSQMMPTHTTVYTTTHFSPATRTTVLETDHFPVYAPPVLTENRVASRSHLTSALYR
ncbi:uncharacterized protein LOC141858430 isoform X2 [Brevipalpus obovatus]|uniref:uncharacterized protein LOC141858430 isoform X2 n=1 Tax=Brevipalpus obovatus TaxID=246614 RepID=UPI003D9FA770